MSTDEMMLDPELAMDLFMSGTGTTHRGWTLVAKAMLDKTRWSIIHTMVIEKDGEYYETFYEEGATEYQETPEQDHPLTRVYPHRMVAVTYEKEPDGEEGKLPESLTTFSLALLVDKAQQGNASAEDARVLALAFMKLELYCIERMPPS